MANALKILAQVLTPPLRAAVPVEQKALSGVDGGRGWTRILEPFTGAWQKNIEVNYDSVLAFHAIFSCITLIASDIAKLRLKLVEKKGDIWVETTSPAYSPVLRSPNPYQNRIQFWECWILSKLMKGNTYVLKRRDARNVVVGLYVLDPNRTRPLVSDDGQVFYQVQADNLTGVEGPITVPAREIIHDRMNTLFHPLVGVSPIFANALAATQGLRIQNNSARFYGNNAQPSGLLTAPGNIPDNIAERLKSDWEDNFGGENYGRVAVLGSGLTFEKLAMTAVEGQLIEQLKWTAEVACSTFHVPPYKIGIGVMPTYNNIQSLNVEYYSQCLQYLLEAGELCMDEGLGIGEGVGPSPMGTEFDTENLLRMDSVTLAEVTDKLKSTLTPDEQRAVWSKPPTPGGDVVYRQQQDFSLAALAKRDALADPFNPPAPVAPAAPPAAAPAPAQDNANAGNQRRALAAETADEIANRLLRRSVELGFAA
jgi:HK97 family phage portal protein